MLYGPFIRDRVAHWTKPSCRPRAGSGVFHGPFVLIAFGKAEWLRAGSCAALARTSTRRARMGSDVLFHPNVKATMTIVIATSTQITVDRSPPTNETITIAGRYPMGIKALLFSLNPALMRLPLR